MRHFKQCYFNNIQQYSADISHTCVPNPPARRLGSPRCRPSHTPPHPRTPPPAPPQRGWGAGRCFASSPELSRSRPRPLPRRRGPRGTPSCFLGSFREGRCYRETLRKTTTLIKEGYHESQSSSMPLSRISIRQANCTRSVPLSLTGSWKRARRRDRAVSRRSVRGSGGLRIERGAERTAKMRRRRTAEIRRDDEQGTICIR